MLFPRTATLLRVDPCGLFAQMGFSSSPLLPFSSVLPLVLSSLPISLPRSPRFSPQVRPSLFGNLVAQFVGKGAYPQARAVMLTECGSHATVGLHLGDYDEAEIHGAYALLPKLARGMLLMHDANFFGGAYLEALNAKGVRALFALPSTVALKRVRNLPDGSYLAQLKPQKRAVYPMQQGVWLRVIEYQITDERLGEPGRVYRLGTTWLNPRTAPATELLVLYHERWEIEIVVDEIKTHLRMQQKVLRSHTPEGVRKAPLRTLRGPLRHSHFDVSLRRAGGPGPRSLELYRGGLSALRNGGR